MKKFVQLTLMMCIVAASSGCAAEKTPEPGTLTPVRVALDWTPNTNHTGLYVALENRYYKDQGLDVTISEPPEDGALPLLAAGKADFAVSFQEEIASALSADVPLPVEAVAAIIQHNTSGIMSLKEKNILSPKDMENHNYATWEMPIEKAILRDVVAKGGGDFDKIEMIPSTVTDVITALQTDIDTLWVYYAWDGIAAEVKGLDTNFFYLKDLEPALDFYTPVLASSEAYLSENEDTARKFLAATKLGYEFAIERPDEAAAILCAQVPGLDENIATASARYLAQQYKADAPEWGVIASDRWDAFYDWLYEHDVIPKKLNAGQGFTNAYLPE